MLALVTHRLRAGGRRLGRRLLLLLLLLLLGGVAAVEVQQRGAELCEKAREDRRDHAAIQGGAA